MSAEIASSSQVCRRAERRAVQLSRDEGFLESAVLIYLNRLSDFLFVAARTAARAPHLHVFCVQE